jgi:hypothetical protein
MDVEMLTEAAHRHRRALDVPARPASPPRRRPLQLTRAGALPQNKITGVALVGFDLDAGASAQFIEALAREPAIVGETGDIEVDVARRALVCAPASDQGCDQCEHVVNRCGGTRLTIRRQHPECGLVLVHGRDVALGQDRRLDALLGGAADDLVIDVGDVAHVGDGITGMAQVPHHHVKRDQRPRMAEMAMVIHRHAADVDPDPAGLHRLKRLLFACQAVVDVQHGSSTGFGGRSDQPPDASAHQAAACCRRRRVSAGPSTAASAGNSGPYRRPVSAMRKGMNSSFPRAPV